MLDEAYNSADDSVKESSRAKFVREDIMSNGWLWAPVVNVWTPRNIDNPGMYGVFDEAGEGLGRIYTTEELEDRLSGGKTERGVRFSKDRTVSFAPLNTIKGGYHEKGTLAQDGAFIGNYEVEGAEALDRVAKEFRSKPYSWVVSNDSNENIQTLSALSRHGILGDDRLDANFDSNGNSRDGYVLSVSGSKLVAEGDALSESK
ncbi:MAG: hypothetical protein KJ718_00570 [Nanoarchaeota archaeon]|nr:hypothetical protein [Nanoarchaeota archaeon]